MPLIRMERRGSIALLRLDNRVTQAISPQLVSDFAKVLETVKADCRGLVIAGGQKFFSIGFDLPLLLGFDRVAMTDFFSRFNKLVYDLYSLGMPTAAVLGGHAIAGGNILALATDYRYAAQGKQQIGLNEIKLGVPVPYLADLILRQLVGDRTATEMIFGGAFMTMDQAHQVKLVDAIFPSETLEERAMHKISELAGFDPGAFSVVKANRAEAVRSLYQHNYKIKNQAFIDAWFDPAVQSKLQSAARHF